MGFGNCPNLLGVYFNGDAPTVSSDAFYLNYTPPNYYLPLIMSQAIAYRLPTAVGWTDSFAYLPVQPWLPQLQTYGGSIGVKTNQFSFNISWANGQNVVVEASTDLLNWQPLATNTLTADSANFCDPDWASYPGRFYRLRSP